jgi:hypothetical protein
LWKRRKVDSHWGCSAYLKSTKRRCFRQARIGAIYCQKHQGSAENPPPLMGCTTTDHVVPSFLCIARLDKIENRRCAKPMIQGSMHCDLYVTCMVTAPSDPHPKLQQQCHMTVATHNAATAPINPHPKLQQQCHMMWLHRMQQHHQVTTYQTPTAVSHDSGCPQCCNSLA